MSYTPQLQPQENFLKTYYARLVTDTEKIPGAPFFSLKVKTGEQYIESSTQKSIEGFIKSVKTEVREYENKKSKTIDTMIVLKISFMTHDGTDPVVIVFNSPLSGLVRSLVATIAGIPDFRIPVRLSTYISKNGYVSLVAINPDGGALLRRADDLNMKDLTEKFVTSVDLPNGKKFRDFTKLDEFLCGVVEAVDEKIQTMLKSNESIVDESEHDVSTPSDDEGLTMADLEEAQQALASTPTESKPHPFDNATQKLKAKSKANESEDDDDKLPF